MSKTRRPNHPNEEPRSITLDSPAFAQFESLIDAELNSLEERWSDLAAPNAAHYAERKSMQASRM